MGGYGRDGMGMYHFQIQLVLQNVMELQGYNSAPSAFQIKVMALLVEWEWVIITAAVMELLMAWGATVSRYSVLMIVLRLSL